MRYSENTSVVDYTEQLITTIHKTGKVIEGPIKRRSYELLTMLGARDDIKHNPRNSNGWRNMSPYSADFKNIVPYYARSERVDVDNGATYRWIAEGTTSKDISRMFGSTSTAARMFNTRNKTLLVNGAFIKLKEQKMNLALTLAFVRETAGLISGTANKLRRAYYFIKRGRWKAAADVLGLRYKDELAGNYLAILFGWMQLARDLQGAAEMLSDLSRPKNYFVYGRSRNESTRKQTFGPQHVYVGYTHCNLTMEATYKSDQKCVVVGQVSHEGLVNLKRSGVLNPMLIMWDVVRYTWILDQFVSIGQYLDAYDATAGLAMVGGCYTEYADCKAYVYPSDYGNTKVTAFSPGFVSTVSVRRTLVSDDDIGIVLKNPFDMDVKIALAAVLALTKALAKDGPFDVPFGGKGPFR